MSNNLYDYSDEFIEDLTTEELETIRALIEAELYERDMNARLRGDNNDV